MFDPNQKNQKAYDQMAYLYNDPQHPDMQWNTQIERPSLLAFLPPVQNRSILELGSSAGQLAELLITKGAKKVFGLDFSQQMVDLALARNLKNFQAKNHYLNYELNLKFKFDWVISSLTLHYVQDWTNVFKTIKNHLKKNGKLFLQLDNFAHDYALNQNLKHNDLIQDTWVKGGTKFEIFLYYKAEAEVIKFAQSYGFKLIKKQYSQSAVINGKNNAQNYVLFEFSLA